MCLDELDYNFIKAYQGNIAEVQNCTRRECRENEYISLYIIMLQMNQGNQNKTEVDPYLVLLRCQQLFQILREKALVQVIKIRPNIEPVQAPIQCTKA